MEKEKRNLTAHEFQIFVESSQAVDWSQNIGPVYSTAPVQNIWAHDTPNMKLLSSFLRKKIVFFRHAN